MNAALELHKCLVLDSVEMLTAMDIPFRICFSPPRAGETMRAWLGSGHTYMPQEGQDLGERMEHAFARVFSEGYARAVLIGTDIPELTSAVLTEALIALNTNANDAVIGPAVDGGYYLIGFRAETFLPAVFHGILWSTCTVRSETLKILATSGKRTLLLPELNDLDTGDDLAGFFKRNRDRRKGASRTLTYLTDHQDALFCKAR
jgi:rSAM/selenodomain-associated transferase 1